MLVLRMVGVGSLTPNCFVVSLERLISSSIQLELCTAAVSHRRLQGRRHLQRRPSSGKLPTSGHASASKCWSCLGALL